MSESELTIVRPGQSIADAVKQDIQQTAQAKQILQIKQQVSGKIQPVLNALFQGFALDPDHAFSICLDYAAGIAIGTGKSKEDFYKGADKCWAAQVAQAESVKEEQGKMLLGIARQVMAQKKPIDVNILGQLQALGVAVPDDLQSYIDAQKAAPEASKN